MIKIQRLASISCQTDQTNSKLQKRSNYNVLHRIDVKTIKNVAFRRKTFEIKLNYKSNQITTICIDLTSKRSKILSYIAKHSKQRKTTKVIKIQLLASIWCQNILNYKSDQNTKTCIDFMSNRSKQLKTTKAIKLRWIASISSQIDQNNAKVQKRSNYDELHRFHLKSIKTTQITKAIKLQWIASIWRHNDQKCWVTSQCIQNNTKLQK